MKDVILGKEDPGHSHPQRDPEFRGLRSILCESRSIGIKCVDKDTSQVTRTEMHSVPISSYSGSNLRAGSCNHKGTVTLNLSRKRICKKGKRGRNMCES